MKNRKQNRIHRRAKKEYEKLMEGYTPSLPSNLPPPIQPGEVFRKFSFYDESRRTYTGFNTTYIG